MNDLPGVSETLGWVRDLKVAQQEFAAREERLEREYRLSTARLRHRIEQENGAAAEAVSLAMQEAATTRQAEVSHIEVRHERRRARIDRAQVSARKAELKSIGDFEAKSKFEVQRDQLQSTRARDEQLQAEKQRLADFNATLTTERDGLAEFEGYALSTLSGYPRFQNLLLESDVRTPASAEADEVQLLEQFRAKLKEAGQILNRIRHSFLPLFFKFLPLWLWILLLVVVHTPVVPVLQHFEIQSFTWLHAGISLVVTIAILVGLYLLGRRMTAPSVKQLITTLEAARGLYDACGAASGARHERAVAQIHAAHESIVEKLNRDWKIVIKTSAERRMNIEVKLKERLSHAQDKNERMLKARLANLDQSHGGSLDQVQVESSERQAALSAELAVEQQKIETDHEAGWRTLETEWNEKTQAIYAQLTRAANTAGELFADWSGDWMNAWMPPEVFAGGVRFSTLKVNAAALTDAAPKNPRLSLPGPLEFIQPLTLTIPREGSLVIETGDTGRDEAVAALNNIVIRLLAAAPPGRLQFTLLDPVELGQSFAGIMHLADYEDRLINSRIWTQTGQIEEQLARLNEHIEKVAQMYLRNEYETITEYNEQAGRIAEKYHFLIIADFPVNFSDLAARRLQSILASGPRCGVYTLLHHDARRMMPADFVQEDLRKNCVHVRIGKNGTFIGDEPMDGVTVSLDTPPAADLATPFLHKVGKASIDSNRVEVPFADVIPPENEFWSLDTTSELRVPIGRTGATKLQQLSIGKGTRQHALIAGKTGSGKSTLFHVVVTNLALWCSPEQVEFYLVDFKKGVEFKCYATHRLPHARVVAIESDREFGLSVLERVDEELKRRGEMFRKLGAQDIAGYKRAGGKESIPRTLLIIDEFQEFFVEDDRISQGAALLLDRIVRQGRAFGIHVLLGSQTLGGAYTLARATLGQMVIRIALQCNEADAYLIMDEENPAPRLLTRPGEAIYNDTAGTIEGNSPFQIVWLPDRERDQWLEKAHALAEEATQRAAGVAPADQTSKASRTLRYAGPIIFEGNAPADVRENVLLEQSLTAATVQPTSTPRAWLGAPNSIKGPTEAAFARQSGNHLLLIGQRNEAALAVLGISLISLAAQHQKDGARFIVLDANPPESGARKFLKQIVAAIPHDIRLVQHHELDEVMADLAAELARRTDENHGAGAPNIFVVVHELPKFKKLRYEEDFAFSLDDTKAEANPGVTFNNLIIEGPSLGIHAVCSCDTYNNLGRCLSRKAVGEFEMRILFQMSANDSAALIDSPKAGDLGLHRAIFSNGAQGWMETFRPYSLPDKVWIETARLGLKRLLA